MGPTRRFTIYAMVVSQLAMAGVGCRQDGGSSVAASGTRVGAATSQAGVTVGDIVYRVLRHNLETSTTNAAQQVAALDARKDEFIAAVNTIIPASVAAMTGGLMNAVGALVDDNTLPSMSEAMASILDLAANDPQDPQQLTLNAIATLANGRTPIDRSTAMKLASRLLAYQDLDRLLQGIGTVITANDGSAPGSRDLLSDLLGVGSRLLSGLNRPAPGTQPATSPMTDALLKPIQLRGGQQVGGPAWAVRLDPNSNPSVAIDPSTGTLYQPFVDGGSGFAATNQNGDPIDAQGNVISIPAFGDTGLRDQDARALAPDGNPLYVYFDVKQTALGQLASMAGEIEGQDIPVNLLNAFDSLAGRVTYQDANGQYTGYASDNPLIDLAWGGLEVFRYNEAPKLLEGASALINGDQAKAEEVLVHLTQVIDILRSANFVSGNTQGSMLDQIVPQLNAAFNANGSGNASSTARALLDAFNSSEAQLRNLPSGFAKMMMYSDANMTVPAGPGAPSLMERLLDMMAEANTCGINIGWPFNIHLNMANMYLDAMAGNLSFLGMTIDVHTMNSLSFLFPYLCSAIQQQNLISLNAFANSGALDAMIPIAKVFSNAGQTEQLKNVMLALQPNYATNVAPNEPIIAQVLNSGAVEELFDVLNMMTTTTVPSTGELMSDVTADFLAAMVDTNRGIRNRQGQPVMSLLHLVVQPLSALSDRIAQRGLTQAFSQAMNQTLDIVLETVVVGASTQNPLGTRLLKNQGLIPVTAALLQQMSSSMSMLPNVRNNDITDQETSLVNLMTGRDLPIVVDVLSAVEKSGQKQLIHDALTHLLTPDVSATTDVYGAILQVVAPMLQGHTDPTATVDMLRFLGKAIDPHRGLAKPIVEGFVRLIGAPNQNPVIMQVIRNAIDKGPAGNSTAPIETVMSVLNDVKTAKNGGPGSTAPMTVTDVHTMLQNMIDFMRDQQNGLEHIWAELRNRNNP